ncbi:MAG: TadE/TadG family type IV pilus assembly protein [Candidatus Limnocylindria bacterium]
MTTLFRKRDARAGQSMVEFALILPLFILMVFGILDFGRAIYAYSTINNAAREGARWAIVDQGVGHIQDAAANHGVGLGIDSDDVDVAFVNHSDGSPCGSIGTGAVSLCSANVRVPYRYEAVTPILGAILGTIDMAGESQFRIEVNCNGPACPYGS